MHVDRSRFLMITATIAAGACAPAPAPQAPVVVADPAEGSTPPVVDVPAATAGSEHDSSDPASSALSSATWSSQPGGDPPDGEVGDDSSGEPTHAPSELVARCQSLKPPSGPSCEGFHLAQALCEAFDRALVPAVARAAVQCLLGHSGSRDICQPRAREDCFAKALGAAPRARPDRGQCAPLVSHCTQGGHSSKMLTKANCRRAVAAVRPAFRKEMLTCIAESCGIRQCVYLVEP